MKTYFKTMQPHMYAVSVTDIFLIFVQFNIQHQLKCYSRAKPSPL